jgi:glyoxylase-like metal-dependent hydrolase (beta-lactamase superfamily II)
MSLGKLPTRIVKDSMFGLRMREIDVWSDRVAVALGRNPGPFTGPGTNTYIVGTGRRPLLLDTGQGAPDYIPVLERALDEARGAKTVQAVLVTHAHPDHVGGVESIRARFGPVELMKKPWPGRRSHLEFTAIDDGGRIETDGATLHAIWTPGHAADHLCFYFDEEKALFTGDLVLGAGTVFIPPDGGLADYLNSLWRILALDVAVIYPAHGPAIHNPREKVEAYLAHRALREEQILAGLRDGVHRIPDLVRSIYTDVAEFMHPVAAWSVEAHLRKLECEGRVQETGGEWFCC